jgi:putative FmdB family regulatory protein
VPTYSYRCTACGDAFDIQQSFTDANLTVCPACGGALRKVFSPVGVSFTGSGFYRNDSRAKPAGDKSAAKTGGGDSSSESKSSESKSGDSKSGEAKSDKAKPDKSAPAAKEKTSATSSSTSGSGKSTSKK